MTVTVLMISPGFPGDMPHFTRGLAAVGARVLGVGDQPQGGLPQSCREALTAYLQVRDLWDEDATIEQVRQWLGGREVDRVECLWEPGVVLAARMRQALGAPGLSIESAHAFRDKELMKQVLDRAGLRTPKHARARTQAECREVAERFGYPLIIKPIAGAGSADTYPLHSPQDLEQALEVLGHIDEVSVEEFIEGEEFTYDTVSIQGTPAFQNVAWYRPKPLVMRLNAWISPQAICMRDLERDELRPGVELGHGVLKALEFETGFTHMEWFLTPDGEAVFGEIGARSPGGRLTHGMNVAYGTDLFAGWAEAVCYQRFSQPAAPNQNAAVVFKRSEGGGDRITRLEGLGPLLAEYGEHFPVVDLNPIGAPRKDWRRVVEGDGWIVIRHPDLDATLQLANRVSTEVRLYAD
ncbi:MAG: ATP-grasp domain-containing protein [Planctomycetota bacterium]|nr:ATP-grasp domain-containing protein [Planctomycetota bacterium]